MKNGYKLGSAAIAAAIALVGCGGGSSSSTPATVTGNLFNTYVEGATYECSSGKTGTTDSMGTYTCNAGDTVEFFLGNYSIGSTTAVSGILDTDLIYDTEAADIHILRLLDGIDDGSDGVITIPEGFDALDEVTAAPGDAGFEEQVEAVGVTLEDETVAVINHAENLLQAYLGGKTFYTVESDYIDRLVIDENVTSTTWTEITPGVTVPGEGGDLLEIRTTQGTLETQLWVDGDEPPFYLVLAEQTSDYLLFNVFDGAGTADGQTRLYFDQAKAEAYYDSLQPIPMTEAMLIGKTFYTDGGSDFEEISFISSTEVTFREVLIAQDGSIMVDTGANILPYTINSSGEVVITFSDGGTNIYQLLSMTDTQWNMTKNGDANSPYSTWLLSAPSNLPQPVTDPVTDPVADPVTLVTFVSGKSFDIGAGFDLTFGSDYSYSDTDGCTGTWSELTSTSLAVTGGCSFDITFNGELVDGVAVTVNVTDVTPTETFDTTFTEVTSTTIPTADLLRSKLSGATYYGAGDGNIIEEMVFNADVTTLTWTEVVGGIGSAGETISLDGMVLTFVSAANEQVTFTVIADTYLEYSFDNGAGTSRWFTTQAEAQSYYGIY